MAAVDGVGPGDDSARRVLITGPGHHRGRNRLLAAFAVAVGVVLVVGTVSLARTKNFGLRASTAAMTVTSPVTTAHRPAVLALPEGSTVVAYHFRPVVSPVTVAGGLPAATAITQTSAELLVSWNTDSTFAEPSPSTSGASAPPRSAAPSTAEGYAVTGQLTDLPFEDSTATDHTDRPLT